MTKAHAVRKKFHAGMKWKSDIFIKAGSREFSGEQILDTFIDAEMLSTQFMSFFVACISHDERHKADGGGYRVFLSSELGEYVNIEEDPDISQWESPAALAVLQRDIGDLDPTKVKLFLLPVMEEEHYSVYCINFIHDRIDVLDSSAEHHTVYHQVLGDRIIRRLNLLFQEATNGKIKEFTRFKRPIIDAFVSSRMTMTVGYMHSSSWSFGMVTLSMFQSSQKTHITTSLRASPTVSLSPFPFLTL